MQTIMSYIVIELFYLTLNVSKSNLYAHLSTSYQW